MFNRVRRDVCGDRGASDAQHERSFSADSRRIPLSRPRRLLPDQSRARPQEVFL